MDAVDAKSGTSFGGHSFDARDVSPEPLPVDEFESVEPRLRAGKGTAVSVPDAGDRCIDILVREAFSGRARRVGLTGRRVVLEHASPIGRPLGRGYTPLSPAASTSGVAIDVAARQPRMRQERASSTNAS